MIWKRTAIKKLGSVIESFIDLLGITYLLPLWAPVRMWGLMRVIVVQTRRHCHQSLLTGSEPIVWKQAGEWFLPSKRNFFSPNLKTFQSQSDRNWEQMGRNGSLVDWNPVWHKNEILAENFLAAAPESLWKKQVVLMSRCRWQKTVSRRQSSVDFLYCAVSRNSCQPLFSSRPG